MKENLQDEINDMMFDYRYYIDIRLHFDLLPFFKVFYEDGNRESQ